MESTLVEFWAMIWERKSHAIVMLSHLEENGRVCIMCIYSTNLTKQFWVGGLCKVLAQQSRGGGNENWTICN